MMSSDKRKKTRTLVVLNANDADMVCSDSVTLSDNVLKRINEGSSGKSQESIDDYNKEEKKYWKNRVACLDEEHRDIEKLYKEEFERAKKNYTSEYSHLVDGDSCKTMTDKIIDCYKSNLGESLRCSKIVEEFTSCMQAAGNDAIKKL